LRAGRKALRAALLRAAAWLLPVFRLIWLAMAADACEGASCSGRVLSVR
jgi:hypothetical protein